MWAYRGVAQSVSRSLLPTNLSLLSRFLQLPVPLGMDLRLTPSDAESLKQSGSLGIYEGSAEKFHVAEGEKLMRDVKL
jgi:hypothetical protein